jgi:hypothetical protein
MPGSDRFFVGQCFFSVTANRHRGETNGRISSRAGLRGPGTLLAVGQFPDLSGRLALFALA